MIGRRAVIGLSLLCALLLSALAAHSASAVERTTSKNTTAFTCVEQGKFEGNFSDPHCSFTSGSGIWTHTSLSVGTTTELGATNEKVTNSTKEDEPAVLKGTVGLAKVEIQCTTVKNNTKNSTIHNVEPAEKQHTVTGTLEVEFSSCTVKLLSKCVVAEPISAKATFHGVEGFSGPLNEPNAMGLEFVGSGEEETFAEIEFKNKGAEKCSLNGFRFKVKGNAISTSELGFGGSQENKHSGATLAFTPSFKMQTLKLGPNAAEFQGIFTPTMAGGGSPIALTTTT